MKCLSDPILGVTLWICFLAQHGSIVNAECSSHIKIKVNPYLHKSSYTIGVHATLDLESALDETHQVFAEYLTATAGIRFDPPIQFKVDAKDYDGIFTATKNQDIDFIYSNPGVYSCVGTQFGATALATVVRRVSIRGQILDLDVYGGVIAVRYDNDQINTILDLKDKIIGAGSILDLMGGQMQIFEMEKAGMSYVNDPKQVVFAKSQAEVVRGVASGRFDVGFVRTDQIELTTDANGTLLDPDLFKIIDPKMDIMESGEIFPFLHSTNIYPEWPVSALSHVPGDVQLAVQDALRDFGAYAAIGQALQQCLDSGNETQLCNVMNFEDITPNPPCDATNDLALLVAQGSNKSHINSFRTASSYFELFQVEQDAGFLFQDESTGAWQCLRPSSLFDGITCPKGHFKRNAIEFQNGCSQVGLSCIDDDNDNEDFDYDCFCKPCVKAHEVDVYHLEAGEKDPHMEDYYGDSLPGCEKMSICATIEQGQSITLRIFDNMFRDGAVVNVTIHAGKNPKSAPVRHLPDTHAYEFTVTDNTAQVQVIEILVDGKPIDTSPIRVMVLNYDCDAQYGENSHRVADSEGRCVCAGHTYPMGNSCIDSTYFFLVIFSAVLLVMGILVVFYLGYKKKQSDSVWHISVDELHFNEPPDVIGQGGFGVVILGEYRGTKVAVKRVLPPSKASKSPNSSMTSEPEEKEGMIEPTSNDLRSTKGSKGSQSTMTVHKKIKFCEDSTSVPGDIESQTTKKITNPGSHSTSGGSLDDWDRLWNDRHSSNDMLKLLQSATLSDHGSGSLTGRYSSVSTSGILRRYLPLCLRFDPHSRRVAEFVNEMRMLSRLRHPCITTVMGAVVSSSIDPMLVMEYMEYGSLYDLLHNETLILGGEIILQMARDIVQGIQFLHASRPPILHGDLKARNVLVDARFRAKVADFGFSHCTSTGHRKSTTTSTALLKGTPFYMAPEYLRRRTEYTSACDMYSLAMIVYELYARSAPFEGEDPRKLLPKICHPRLNKRPPIPKACPPKMVEIMKKCWGANPCFRPTAKDLDYLLMEMNARDAEPLTVVAIGCSTDAMGVVREQQQLQQQHRPTSLYDVFPKHIADALQAGKKVEAESHDIVTVVFSDIVGFTTISEQVSPLKIAQMLDRLYHALDTLCRKHHIFKVETVGDAYMGVTNLDGSESESHVKQVAEYSLEALQAASEILIDEEDPSRGYVQIRLGFHSGPVVSNVIGSLNPRYGLFGDTVNTASRMESNSVPGRIHCSFVSAQLLEAQAPWIPQKLRGLIKIKGKGKMKTYWIGNDDDHVVVKPAAREYASVKNKAPSKVMTPLVSLPMTEVILEMSDEQEDSLSTPQPRHDDGHLKVDAVEDHQTAVTSVDHDVDKNHHRNNNINAPCSPDSLGISHRTQATLICDSLSDIGEGEDGDYVTNNNGPEHRPKLRMKKKMIQMDGSLKHFIDCSNLIELPVTHMESTRSGSDDDNDNDNNSNNKNGDTMHPTTVNQRTSVLINGQLTGGIRNSGNP